MSRKTIAFQVPRPAPVSRELAVAPAPNVIEAEEWVSRTEPPHQRIHAALGETPAAPGPGTITLTISAEPEWIEAVWLGLFLPPVAFWLWGLSATRRSFRLFAR
jgi:hypothetical protein